MALFIRNLWKYLLFMVFAVVSSVLGADSSPVGSNRQQRAQPFQRLYVNIQSQEDLFPKDAEEFKKLTYVKNVNGGSGGVYIFKDPSGREFTFKCLDNQEQMNEEILADALYKSLGVLVPDFAAYKTDGSIKPNSMPENIKCHGIFRLALFIEPAQVHSKNDTQEVRKHFLVDAFLANWDIVVDKLKNIIIDKQQQYWRVDNGGALQYSARGALKAESSKGWNPFVVSELETMRDPNINNGADYYTGLTNEDLKEQLEDILQHKAQMLQTLETVSKALNIKDVRALREMLGRRLSYLAHVLGKTASSRHEPAANHTAAGVLIYNEEEKSILLGKRINHKWWGNLGGKSDINVASPDKTLIETAIRETLEESLGLISLTQAQLSRAPFHDLKKNSESDAVSFLYRMYVVPHEHIDPADLNNAPEDQAHHWKKEYTDFMWVPVDLVLSAVQKNDLIEEEKQQTIAIDVAGHGSIILHPPFYQMLKESVVQEMLKKIAQGQTIPQKATRSFPSLEQESQELSEQIVRHGQVMGDIKARQDAHLKKDYINQDLPFTQSGAHLKVILGNLPEKSAEQVQLFLEKNYNEALNDKDYIDALTKALEAELENKDKIVFYHASTSEVSFVYDIYTEFKAQLNNLTANQRASLRLLEQPFEHMENVHEFIKKFSTPEGCVHNYDEKNGIRYDECGLSFNAFLFGSHQINNSKTYEFFYASKSAKDYDIESLLKSIVSSGIPLSIAHYKALFNQFYKSNNNTKLVQVFVEPSIVDSVAYMAVEGGDVIRLPDGYYGFSKIIQPFRKKPDND
jgi:8-oxo-dGTP pyrophosphatase MutT (NUDIX family)